jgi:hypothetical protein
LKGEKGMASPTTVTVTYISTLPSTTSTAQLNIPSGGDYGSFVRNMVMNGGVWVTLAGVYTFIPMGQIVSITAQ